MRSLALKQVGMPTYLGFFFTITSCMHVHVGKEKHKLVHTIYRSPDRESNPRPLAYGNTASIEGTTTLIEGSIDQGRT
jgi:hypothetical protein